MNKMKWLFVALGIVALAACSSRHVPAQWRHLGISEEGLVQVEKETDENGLYIEYRGRSREELIDSVSRSLLAAGYTKSGTAFNGTVFGFTKNNDRLAMKVDEFDSLYLAIFNEKGKEPLLHGVVFGKYTLGPAVTGDAAKKALLKELEEK